MKITVQESGLDHFFHEPPSDVVEEFWALRWPIKAKVGDAIEFRCNGELIARSKVSRVERPGESECSSTGKYGNRWKVYWRLDEFEDLRK